MIEDEKEQLFNEINSRYNYNINKSFLGFAIYEGTEILRTNFFKFTMARFSYKIKEIIKEILKKMGFCTESDTKNDFNLEKFFNFIDKDNNLINEKINNNLEKNIKKQKGEINDNNNINKNKIYKNKYKDILNELKSIYNEYANIASKAYDDRFNYFFIVYHLEIKCKACCCNKEANNIYYKIVNDINVKLNNDYETYEKKFISMRKTLIDLNNNIS